MNGRCKGRSNEGLRMNAICQGRNLKGGEQKEGRQKQRKRLRESDSPSGSESEPVKRKYPTALLANNRLVDLCGQKNGRWKNKSLSLGNLCCLQVVVCLLAGMQCMACNPQCNHAWRPRRPRRGHLLTRPVRSRHVYASPVPCWARQRDLMLPSIPRRRLGLTRPSDLLWPARQGPRLPVLYLVGSPSSNAPSNQRKMR